MRKIEMRKLRAYSVSAIVILMLSGAITHVSFGTYSSFGYETFSAICPLGALETALAGNTFVPRLFMGLGVTVLATILLGRVFCSWACPVPFVNRWFGKKNESPAAADPGLEECSGASGTAGHRLQPTEPAAPPDKATPDNRYYVLGGALLSSAIFGFPVFCLICPIGLFLGTLFSLMRLLRFNEPTITLLVFPVVLIIEVVLMRKWCHTFCPLGALLGLLSGLNKTMHPRINTNRCLVTNQGMNCFACKQSCPEGIDLHDKQTGLLGGLCTKCGDCVDSCPEKAIRFYWIKENNNADPTR